MLPRHAADYRTLLWMFVLARGLVPAIYIWPAIMPYVWWLSMYFAVSAGVIAHNHNHSPTFKNKRANNAFGNWVSLFYGYPTFAWIPTHNLNHHKFVNTAGDATITWRYTNKHVGWVAMSYFFVSSYFQSDPIKAYMAKAKERNRPLYRRIQFQYAIWITGYAIMFALAVFLHGWALGAAVFFVAIGIPAIFSMWTIMLFNYEQHVHTDPWSKLDHSRNFVGKFTNFLLFGNGLHTIHHEQAGLHWSKARAAHDEIKDGINPVLNEKSFWWYMIRQYLLAPFFPKLGTKQIGAGPMNPPSGKLDIKTADVGLGEAGTNSQIDIADGLAQ